MPTHKHHLCLTHQRKQQQQRTRHSGSHSFPPRTQRIGRHTNRIYVQLHLSYPSSLSCGFPVVHFLSHTTITDVAYQPPLQKMYLYSTAPHCSCENLLYRLYSHSHSQFYSFSSSLYSQSTSTSQLYSLVSPPPFVPFNISQSHTSVLCPVLNPSMCTSQVRIISSPHRAKVEHRAHSPLASTEHLQQPAPTIPNSE